MRACRVHTNRGNEIVLHCYFKVIFIFHRHSRAFATLLMHPLTFFPCVVSQPSLTLANLLNALGGRYRVERGALQSNVIDLYQPEHMTGFY